MTHFSCSAPNHVYRTKNHFTRKPRFKGYLTYYFNSTRFREYNGKKLDLDISPNQSKTHKDRFILLKKLSSEIYKALLTGWSPVPKIEALKEEITIKNAFERIRRNKDNSNLSKAYKRDFSSVLDKFFDYLTPSKLDCKVPDILNVDIDGGYAKSGHAFFFKVATPFRLKVFNRLILKCFKTLSLCSGDVSDGGMMKNLQA